MKGTEILGIRPKRLKTFMALKHPTGKWFRQNEEEQILLLQSRMKSELERFSMVDVARNPIGMAAMLGQRIEYQILNTSPMENMLEHNTVADPKLYKLYVKAYKELSLVATEIIQETFRRLFGNGHWVSDEPVDMTRVQT